MIPTGGRLRRIDGGRHRVVQVRVSDAELAVIEARAAGAGVSIAHYVHSAVLADGRLTVADRLYWMREIWNLQRQLFDLRERLGAVVDRIGPGATDLSEVYAAAEAVRRMESAVTESAAGYTRALEEADLRSRREARRGSRRPSVS